jgi:PII-like signaling protein
MKMHKVSMVRIYLTEGEGLAQKLFQRLHDQEQLRGVTLFRAISGFGRSGQIHSATLLDTSLNLPLILEFFDDPERVDVVLEHIQDNIQPGHLVRWTAEINE